MSENQRITPWAESISLRPKRDCCYHDWQRRPLSNASLASTFVTERHADGRTDGWMDGQMVRV